MPFFSARRLCPNCAKPIRKDAAACADCGCELESSQRQAPPPLPEGMARHRGGRIVLLGVVGMLLLPFAGTLLSCAGYLLTPVFRIDALPYLIGGLCVFGCGHFSAVAAVVFAYRDGVGMKARRVDPTGWEVTILGGVLAGLALLLYWCMIGAVVVSLF